MVDPYNEMPSGCSSVGSEQDIILLSPSNNSNLVSYHLDTNLLNNNDTPLVNKAVFGTFTSYDNNFGIILFGNNFFGRRAIIGSNIFSSAIAYSANSFVAESSGAEYDNKVSECSVDNNSPSLVIDNEKSLSITLFNDDKPLVVNTVSGQEAYPEYGVTEFGFELNYFGTSVEKPIMVR